MQSVLSGITPADIRHDPFPHVFVRDVLDDDTHRALNESFPPKRARFDAVIEYEDLVARKPAVLETVRALGWPVEESFYDYRRRHNEVLAALWEHVPDLMPNFEFVFGNVRGARFRTVSATSPATTNWNPGWRRCALAFSPTIGRVVDAVTAAYPFHSLLPWPAPSGAVRERSCAGKQRHGSRSGGVVPRARTVSARREIGAARRFVPIGKVPGRSMLSLTS